ncbi:hypothetical protein QN412_13720 [Pseudomonas sp. RTB3]|uniref:hypothetical protein n=1 Tax=unclassified Pseudomonas TaxID=196821 RepID=UPI002B224F58|nr:MULTISPECIES: hypothetical protein [unclassified Pseudomonas]MEB0007888.1 hypothetical protein [Pseudomonas sp. RTB2]MEB0018002.1 hypothetical protein [Pseudomonas sp. RTB3]MEB0270200.1 hypothetical protein [Pseudomonas sp. 5B4]
MSSKHQKFKITSTKQFIRAIHSYSKAGNKSAPSLRFGLGNARTLTDAFLFPKIVDEIRETPLYLKLIAPTQFPETLSEMKKGVPAIYMLEAQDELIWTASVLSIFKDKLFGFMTAKMQFEGTFLDSRFEEALEILVQIEQTYGLSIWLLKNKICVLQLLYGLKEQKDYLEKIVNTEFFSVHGALVSYHTSLRSEENVTFAEMESELEEYPGEISSYFTYHLTPANLDRIQNTAVVQCAEETQTIIDRLLAHIAMLQLYFAQGHCNPRALDEIIKLSAWIPDASIQNLVRVNAKQPALIDTAELDIFECYALGQYGTKYIRSAEFLEVMAYDKAYDSDPQELESTSLFDETIELMAKTVTYASAQVKIRHRLGKIAMISPSLSLSINISNFLKNAGDTPAVDKRTLKSKLALISGSLANPKSWSLIRHESMAPGFTVALAPEQEKLNTIQLFRYMEEGFEDGARGISRLSLPEYRINTYIGHLAYKLKKYDQAEKHYVLSLATPVQFPQDRVRSYLFNSVFAQEKIEDAVKLAVEHCLRNPNVVDLYPLADLSNAALAIKGLRADIATAILIHLTARQVHTKWERKLSDIHENVLFKAGVDKPSELFAVQADYEPRMLVYFLRHVCVSRILDDSSAYNSVEEIEEERIAICQWLAVLDPPNKSVYASEIKDITRNENIASIWHQFQSSKVYVDEDGLRNFLAPSFKETFRRYLILRDSPSLNTQAEKLAKALERILKDVNSGFKNIKLPASEAESLFNTMIYQFLNAFATHPAYGLDTHLSTAVRHGVFEGHVRTALISILCTKSESGYVLPASFYQKISCQSDAVGSVQAAFTRFSRKIESLIEKYLSDYFRIDSDLTPAGLFSFVLSDEARSDAMARMSTLSAYDDFMNEFFSIAWRLTDNSTQVLKEHVSNSLGMQIYQAFDLILEGLRPTLSDGAFAIVEKEVVDARLRIQRTLEDVAGWFNRPQTSHPDEVDMEMVVVVALKQIANCYTNDKLIPSVDYAANRKVKGQLLSGLVETLFILLQNIIIHGGVARDLKGVRLVFGFSDDALSITLENPIGSSVDIAKLEQSIAESLERYRTGTGLTKASTEGGSGLSKIWRIMEFEIKKPHHLELVANDRMFRAQLTIENIELI